MDASLPDTIAEPKRPVPPATEDCCRSGCTPCVFDLYEEALERYRLEHAAWLARREQAGNAPAP